MSNFYEQGKTVCCICGYAQNYIYLSMFRTYGSADLDGRQPLYGRRSMHAAVIECHNCGYANYKLEYETGLDTETVASFIKSHQYINTDNLELPEEAKKYYRFHLLSKKAANEKDAIMGLLYCAWACDDAHDEFSALHIREILAAHLKHFLLTDIPQGEKTTYILLLADVYRRSNQFEQAVSILDENRNILCSETQKTIVDFQIKLCKNCDNKCYTLDQAEGRPKVEAHPQDDELIGVQILRRNSGNNF